MIELNMTLRSTMVKYFLKVGWHFDQQGNLISINITISVSPTTTVKEMRATFSKTFDEMPASDNAASAYSPVGAVFSKLPKNQP